jgi:glycosyltransferase XagB
MEPAGTPRGIWDRAVWPAPPGRAADVRHAEPRRPPILPRPGPLKACPELDCVRHRIPVAVLAAAERRAREIGLGADRVLVAAGILTEEDYLRALAASAGLPFETLDWVPRSDCPLDDARLVEAATAGLLPLRTPAGLALVVAPRAMAARRIWQMVGRSEELPQRIRLTSTARLRDYILRHGATALGVKAAGDLLARRPHLSAAAIRPRTAMVALAAMLAILVGLLATPTVVNVAIGATLAPVFLAWTGLRAIGAVSALAPQAPMERLPADRLPIYTIIVALYREAAAAHGLIAALDALDYPPEKLDVKIVLESDDLTTHAALSAMALRHPYEILVAPNFGPRTKPKALNAALPFARGTYTVVYDAEDRPEPDQLRRAVAAFLAGPDDLACVQARLCIDNTEDSWLTRVFTAEYAGLFDVFLPGLATHHLPLPLGGSSNHFPTVVLRELGAWDPYNLTEDADLGMRLARFGYVTGVIDSTTFEEAPARLGAWMRQRTRWFKGWIQTWLVHVRRPMALWHDLGARGFWTFQLVVGGTVLAALVHPLFFASALRGLLTGPRDDGANALLLALSITTFLAGYLSSAMLAVIGLKRRGLGAQAWSLLLLPVHWALLSLAAWRALYQLVVDPQRWEKTEHGLARTSRLARRRNNGR